MPVYAAAPRVPYRDAPLPVDQGILERVGFWEAPACHLPFQASGRPTPLLPLWEKRAGGMRGNGARECSTSLISPKNSTLERKEDGGMRGKRRGNAANRASRPRTLPLRAHAGGRGV